MRIEKHLIGQKVIVRYMEDTDSDILGLGLGFLLTSSLMWISNRGHIRDGGIILHPSGVNVLMQKKRHGIRKTSDLSKSDCSLHDICQQRYLVYYESYRDEIVQGRVWSETDRLTRFETGTVRKTEVIADRTI